MVLRQNNIASESAFRYVHPDLNRNINKLIYYAVFERPSKLKTSGYIFASLAWGLIIALTLYCFIKIMRSGNQLKSNDSKE